MIISYVARSELKIHAVSSRNLLTSVNMAMKQVLATHAIAAPKEHTNFCHAGTASEGRGGYEALSIRQH